MDNISEGNWTTYNADGELVTVEGMYFGEHAAWHHKGFTSGEGRLPSQVGRDMGLREVYLLRPKFEVDGVQFDSQYAMIATDLPEGKGVHVYSGTVKIGNWDKVLAMNEDKKRPTKSPHYNLVTPKEFVQIFEEEVVDLDGHPMKTVSMGYLGRYGAKGLFIVVKMPDYEIDGQQISGYLTAWNPIARGDMIHVINSDICVVCQNTLNMSVDGAHKMVRVPHSTEALSQLRMAFGDIYLPALRAQSLAQDAGNFMAKTPYTDTQFDNLLNTVIKKPRLPDVKRMTKHSADERMESFEKKLAEVDTLHLWAKDVRKNAWGISGVTPENAETSWGALQAMTFVASHAPARNGASVWASTLGGVRGQWASSAFIQIMKDVAPNFKTQAVKMPEVE